MIRTSTAIAAAALVLSFILHVLGVNLSWRHGDPEATGQSSDVISTSSDFEDFAEELTEPVFPEEAPQAEPPEETAPEPELTETPTSQAMVASHPHLQEVDAVPENGWSPVAAGKLDTGDFPTAIKDFYLTNPIARASQLMAELSANAKARSEAPIAAE